MHQKRMYTSDLSSSNIINSHTQHPWAVFVPVLVVHTHSHTAAEHSSCGGCCFILFGWQEYNQHTCTRRPCTPVIYLAHLFFFVCHMFWLTEIESACARKVSMQQWYISILLEKFYLQKFTPRTKWTRNAHTLLHSSSSSCCCCCFIMYGWQSFTCRSLHQMHNKLYCTTVAIVVVYPYILFGWQK